MKRIKKIGLAKLFLWSEAERFQTYPEAFAGLDKARVYTKREIATEVFGLFYKDKKGVKPLRGNSIENCFGLALLSDETLMNLRFTKGHENRLFCHSGAGRNPGFSGEKVAIRGINCLRQIGKDRFRATDEAIGIGEAYREGKNVNEWAIPLARQIARFEVRTRLLLYLLGREGWRLRFATPEFFAKPSIKAVLVRGKEHLLPFEDHAMVFNRLLQENRDVALGAWWKAEIEKSGYEIDDGFLFEGIREGPPATNKLNSNIKGGLFLMKYLGILESADGDGWSVCAQKATECFGDEIARDFINTEGVDRFGSPLLILKNITQEMEDPAGLVIVEPLARRWASRNSIPYDDALESFDQFMRQQIYEGRVRVAARHQGQPRHGRGLFGDSTSRRIKLDFLDDEINTHRIVRRECSEKT